MARFITGKTFGTTENCTAALLNQAVNDAKISTDSVDGSTIEVNSDALRLKDAGITTAKILDSSSKTTGVTFAKMQHISTAKVLGRVSASEGDVEEVGVVIGGSGDAGLLFDNDDMLDNSDTAGGSATRGATQQSIKAFVENLIGSADKSGSGVVTEGTQGSITLVGGLIVKFGSVDVNSSSVTLTFKDSSGSNTPFPNAIYGVMVTAQEDSGSGAESAGVSNLALASCVVRGYNSSSGGAVGRVFFIAIGH